MYHEALVLKICDNIAGKPARGAAVASLLPGNKKALWLIDRNAYSEVPGTPSM